MDAAKMLLAGVLLIACMAASGSEDSDTNIMAILKQAGCNTFMTMLKNTQAIRQIQIRLSSDSQGLTLLAPSDEAFTALKPGTLNSLNEEEKSELVQYHVLPKFYTQGQLQEATNPVLTMASHKNIPLGFNITSSSTANSSVDISTGVDSTSVFAPFYSKPPLAVYKIDNLLLPSDIFGPKKAPPAPAPVPTAAPAPEKTRAPPPARLASRSRASVRDTKDKSLATTVTAPAGLFFALVIFVVAAAL